MPTSNFVRLNSCCGCIGLKTGTLVIGFFTEVIAIIRILSSLNVLLQKEPLVQRCNDRMISNYIKLHSHNQERFNLNSSFDDDEGDAFNWFYQKHNIHASSIKSFCHRHVTFMAWSSAVTFIIYLILTAVMIHGVKMKHPRLIKPWLIWVSIQITLCLLSILVNSHEIVASLLSTTIHVYIALVVNSYYHQLRDEESGMVAVVAVTRPQEIVVNIPSPRKSSPFAYDGAPPPYPGMGAPPPPYHDATMIPPPPYSVENPQLFAVATSSQDHGIEGAQAMANPQYGIVYESGPSVFLDPDSPSTSYVVEREQNAESTSLTPRLPGTPSTSNDGATKPEEAVINIEQSTLNDKSLETAECPVDATSPKKSDDDDEEPKQSSKAEK